LASLIDFLELIDGPKFVVLYSGPFHSDGFNHDPEYKRISAIAAKARVALYPVDTGGLRTPVGFRYGDLGGPKTLARLAVETGGRVTYHSNDLGLALARAQRDYGCRYTVGFYDSDPKLDTVRHVSISVKKEGVRAIHPVNYVLRSETKQLDSHARTAGMVPEMYEDGGMTVEALALKPHSAGRWDVLIAARLPAVDSVPGSSAPWMVKGRVITLSGAAVRSFERELPPPGAPGGAEADSSRTLFESMTLKPGRYRVSVVLSREGMSVPWATHADIELSRIPGNQFFLVGPHLGLYAPFVPHETDDAKAGTATGPAWRFEPLVAGSAGQGETIEALTWICHVGDDFATRRVTVERELIRVSGSTIGQFDPVRVDFVERKNLSCHALLDAVPTSALPPGRYSVRAFVLGEEHRSENAFEVTD
jgi:hypothetical protein